MIRPARSRLAAAALAACVAGLGGTLAGTAARAMTKAGVTMPDTMTVAGRTLRLNGIGVRTFTVFNVRGYVGALYLPTRTSDAVTALAEPGPKALIVQFARPASRQQVHDFYLQSSDRYCAAHPCTDADHAAFAQLLATVQAVRAGDRTGLIVTDAGVEVLFNDVRRAMIDSPAFGRTLLDSDLGSTPPSAELRDGLLGRDD